MPTTPTDIPSLITYIEETFTANGIRAITGPEAQEAFLSIISIMPPTLFHDLTVSVANGGIGGIANGTVFAEGTFVQDILIALLRQVVPPTYTPPTVSLVSSVDATINKELGAQISPVLTPTFHQNDAGALASWSIQEDGSQISTSAPYTDTNRQLVAATTTYQAFATYSQGACKNDSFGNQSCGGRVIAGTVGSNIITYNAFRALFLGTPDTTPATSDDVRNDATSQILNPQVGTKFVIDVPYLSATVMFAYPATIEDVSIVECDGSRVEGLFTKTLVNVQGANGFTAISYKVFVFTPVERFQTTARYYITL